MCGRRCWSILHPGTSDEAIPAQMIQKPFALAKRRVHISGINRSASYSRVGSTTVLEVQMCSDTPSRRRLRSSGLQGLDYAIYACDLSCMTSQWQATLALAAPILHPHPPPPFLPLRMCSSPRTITTWIYRRPARAKSNNLPERMRPLLLF